MYVLLLQTINEALEEVSAPIQVVSGYIGQITVSIPWSSLMRSSCKVEVSGLTVTVTPSQSCYGGQGEFSELSISVCLFKMIFLKLYVRISDRQICPYYRSPYCIYNEHYIFQPVCM